MQTHRGWKGSDGLEFDGEVVAGHCEGACRGVGRGRVVGGEIQGFAEQRDGGLRAAAAGQGGGRRREHAYPGGSRVLVRRCGVRQFALGGPGISGGEMQGRAGDVQLPRRGVSRGIARVPAERVQKGRALVPAAEVFTADVGREDTEGRELAGLADERDGILAAPPDALRIRRVVVPAGVQEGVEVHVRSAVPVLADRTVSRRPLWNKRRRERSAGRDCSMKGRGGWAGGGAGA